MLMNDTFDQGAKQWLVFSLFSLVFLFVLHGNFSASNIRINDTVLRIILIPFYIYVGKLIYYFVEDVFEYRAQFLEGMTLAIMAPFFLLSLLNYKDKKFLLRITLVFSIIFILLILGDSRTEPLMLLSALLVMVTFIRRRLVLLSFFPVLLFIVIGIYALIGRGNPEDPSNMALTLENVSSSRFEIWALAITNPPDNQIFGAGIDNTMAYLPANPLNSALHNSFLEIWYETGFLGIGLWLLLFLVLLKNLPKVYLHAGDKHRLVYAVFLGSFVAVLVAGMLDKGYMSVFFKFFIFYLGAMLYVLGKQCSFEQFENERVGNEK